jgi:hypothetical protein
MHPHSFHFWQDLLWFFYCQRCRDTDPTLGGQYINADGIWSTDSESEVEELKEFEEPKPDLPAGWARQRGDRWTENPQHAAAATGWSRLVRVCVSSSTEE